jgi:hypothetical protein
MPKKGGGVELRKTDVRHTRNNSQKKQRRKYFLSNPPFLMVICPVLSLRRITKDQKPPVWEIIIWQ